MFFINIHRNFFAPHRHIGNIEFHIDIVENYVKSYVALLCLCGEWMGY